MNEFNGKIYAALDAWEFSGGISGNGEGRIFNREQLEKEMKYLMESQEELDIEVEFIGECFSYLDEDGDIYIEFG